MSFVYDWTSESEFPRHYIPPEDNWEQSLGLDREELIAAIETMVFMSDRPIGPERIKQLLGVNIPIREILSCLDVLRESYEQKHHGIRLMEVAEGVQFRTKPRYSKYVHSLYKVTGLSLSPTALEVLAIVAYRGPVAKMEIERIRGADSSHILRALMDKRLVKTAGRSEEDARSTAYVTTQEFLEVFSLKSLKDLPPEYELDDMAGSYGQSKIHDLREVVQREHGRFEFDDIDELDQLAAEIKEVSTDTELFREIKADQKRSKDDNEPPPRSAFEILEELVVRAQEEEAKLAAEQEAIQSEVSEQDREELRDLLGQAKESGERFEDLDTADLEEVLESTDEGQDFDPTLALDALDGVSDSHEAQTGSDEGPQDDEIEIELVEEDPETASDSKNRDQIMGLEETLDALFASDEENEGEDALHQALDELDPFRDEDDEGPKTPLH